MERLRTAATEAIYSEEQARRIRGLKVLTSVGKVVCDCYVDPDGRFQVSNVEYASGAGMQEGISNQDVSGIERVARRMVDERLLRFDQIKEEAEETARQRGGDPAD